MNTFLMGRYEQEIMMQFAAMAAKEKEQRKSIGIECKEKDSFESEEVS